MHVTWARLLSILSRQPDSEVQNRRDRLAMATWRLNALQMDSDPLGEPVPRILKLDDDALRLFDEVRREAMERARSSRGLAAGWHGKTPGRVGPCGWRSFSNIWLGR